MRIASRGDSGIWTRRLRGSSTHACRGARLHEEGAGRLCRPCEHAPAHSHARAERERLDDVAAVLDAAIGDDRHAVLRSHLGHPENCSRLQRAGAGAACAIDQGACFHSWQRPLRNLAQSSADLGTEKSMCGSLAPWRAWPRPTAQTSCVVQMDPLPIPTRRPSAPASMRRFPCWANVQQPF